jgi:tetratricopeptide (TPR) repeat protein
LNPIPWLPSIAMVLNNLAIVYQNLSNFNQALPLYEEALQIRKQLAKDKPESYLSDVAATLNNLANLHSTIMEFNRAQILYEEALQIYRQLDQANPQAYLPDLARITASMAVHYLMGSPDQEKSLFFCKESLISSFSFMGHHKLVQNCVDISMQVIEAWGENSKVFLQEVFKEWRNA